MVTQADTQTNLALTQFSALRDLSNGLPHGNHARGRRLLPTAPPLFAGPHFRLTLTACATRRQAAVSKVERYFQPFLV